MTGRCSIWIPLILWAAGVSALLLTVEPENEWAWVSDGGFVQVSSLVVLTFASVAAGWLALTDRVRRWVHLEFAFLLAAYAAREGDLHEHLSRHAKVSQPGRFFPHPEIPLALKIVVFLAMAVLLWLLFRLFRYHFKGLVHGLKERKPWAALVLAWLGAFFLSQLLDQTPLNDYFAGRITEECLELLAAVYVSIALIVWARDAAGSSVLDPWRTPEAH